MYGINIAGGGYSSSNANIIDRKPPPGTLPIKGAPAQLEDPNDPTSVAPSLIKTSGSEPPVPRKLQIHVDGILNRRLYINESDDVTTLYTATIKAGGIFRSGPNVTVYTGTDETQASIVGTASFPSFSQKIDLTLHSQRIFFAQDGFFTHTHSFTSTAGRLRWEHTGIFSQNMTCVDEEGRWLARFDYKRLSMSKLGTLEIVSDQIGGALLDELVVSGIAMTELEKKGRK